MYNQETMKITILISKNSLQNRRCWELFVVERLIRYCGYENVRVVLMTETNTPKKDSFIVRLHYAIESNRSRQNCSTDYFSIVSGCIKDTPFDNSVILNLSYAAHKELAQTYPHVAIWEIHYAGEALQTYSHIGEREILHKAATVNVLLIEYKYGRDPIAIDVAKYNVHYSAVRNFQNAVYSAHLLILKNLKCLGSKHAGYKDTEAGLSNCFIFYAVTFYVSVMSKLYHSLLNRFVSSHYPEKWTIGLSRGSFLKDGISNMRIVSFPRNEFWADPFLWRDPKDRKTWLFIERFPFKEKKGVIACGEIDASLQVHEMHDILVKPYHLSYPHLIEEDGHLYMMPESSANHRLEVYRCEKFPEQWTLYATAFHEESIADTVYYKDHDGQCWLFTTISDSDIIMHCTIMNIYRIDSLKFNKIEPHHMNPIIIDASCARNGGRIYEEDGHVYRSAQINTHGQYGCGISIREIIKLTIDDYEEREVEFLNGNDIPHAIGTHQMCQIDDLFVMDIRK